MLRIVIIIFGDPTGTASTLIEPYRFSTPIGLFVRTEPTKSTQSGFDSQTQCSPALLRVITYPLRS